MPQMLDNVIASAEADATTFSIALTWANGETTTNNFRHLIGKDVGIALADPAVFANVQVGERGRSLEWPGEIDFCADALWFEAHPMEAPGSQRREAAE